MSDKSIYQKNLILTLQLIIASLIGLEVSYNPNPYIEELIFFMTIYIAIKYNLPDTIQTVLYKFIKNIYYYYGDDNKKSS